MKKLNIIICLITSLLLFSCEKDRGNVNLALSDISLVLPENNVIIDLNNEEATYRFLWDKNNEGGSTIIFSTSNYLTKPVYVDAGEGNSLVMTLEEMEDFLTKFGLQGGKEATIFWSVKPTKRLGLATVDIRSFQAISQKKRIVSPENNSVCDLDGLHPDLTIEFSWDKSIVTGGSGFILYLDNSADFSDKAYTLEVGSSYSTLLTHTEMQKVLNVLGVKKYSSGAIYWNIFNTLDNKWVSNDVFSLRVTGFMTYTDIRGEETITYKVTRVNYSDGRSCVWLAENLRTACYTDGTPIESEKVFFAPSSLGSNFVIAYGGYYSCDIKQRIAPEGFHLPSVAEYEKLFGEAEKVSGKWNILKDPVYYAEFDKEDGHVNEWGLGLVSAGMWVNGQLANNNGRWCYLHATDCEPQECILHDGGATLWRPWPQAAPARFILDE